jgi:hypothetical protein
MLLFYLQELDSINNMMKKKEIKFRSSVQKTFTCTTSGISSKDTLPNEYSENVTNIASVKNFAKKLKMIQNERSRSQINSS